MNAAEKVIEQIPVSETPPRGRNFAPKFFRHSVGSPYQTLQPLRDRPMTDNNANSIFTPLSQGYSQVLDKIELSKLLGS